MNNFSVLPQGGIIKNIDTIKEKKHSSKTYKIKENRILGFCDEIEALEQTIYFILNTERYDYLIYPDSYGSELRRTIEMERDIAESELKRRIKEALTQDDRIENVDEFIFEYEKDSVLVKFTVFSIYSKLYESVVI
ncbi:DUF2634 domain-containing protein [Clostridium botulinum]|uniref:DUF2634 domain-containing protein n=1 Tax=Clostridium TaxID=1485 RepID=UPI0002F25205|nr:MULTISPECIES: DUF2634 domain-containing protein [Clostridium]MBN1044597.1 DUF2634 domain-containing protein [Clostridium botulinum]MBN1051262.1 DUF2634 domain-containing protein [Clostridium botulinum]MBN1054553.1 DUF2634 domain-containing protein [Clostridium botulinum]NFO04267.1 DUF2634 domain-containing protein [Clostridium botulinum]UZP04239.1 DUF2634 domain-containing protein [Clostridium botulinum]